MVFPREQYDVLLGGKEELPSTISVIKFVNARSHEITALTEAIEEPQNTHMAFQNMPKHLRRKAMSHNVKRMPRRLQDMYLDQLKKSGMPKKLKRPSRKFRRKPCNLLQEYNRRQRRAVWLETHIWHAKRFHMVEKWGYKLPHFPNEKGFRACYRATAKHCLIQDLSYLNCIELQGPTADILQGLGQLTSPACGLTFAAKSTLSGCREGSVMVFRREAYPFHAIGRVVFMWRPESKHLIRTIWIWCHPAFYSQFLKELITVFQFKPEDSSDKQVVPIEVDDNVKKISEPMTALPKKCKNVEKEKLQTKNIGKLPKFSNKNIVMNLLKDTLNRYRLTGPLSQLVLTESLKFIDINNFVKPKDDNCMEVDSDEQPRSAWLLDFYTNDSTLKSLKEQHLFLKKLKTVNSADELSPRIIVAATIVDPRLSMPTLRIKAVNTGMSEVEALIPEGLSSHSPLWDASLRDTITHSKMATAQLNEVRSRALVPGLGAASWLGYHNVCHLPVLLVQNPGGENQRGYGSGWDVIVPAGWGMPVWLGLVFHGARPGGLRETERLTLEMASGPTLPQDSEAGRQCSQQQRRDHEEKYFRLPPQKRPNFRKLGVISPFRCPLTQLLQDWHPGEQNRDFYVIRNRAQLDFLKCLLNRTKPVVTCTFTDSDKACGLVQVGVEMCGRGTPREGSMICALDIKDLKLKIDKSSQGPTEPLHEDENEVKRKTLREGHLVKLKRLRKKRVKATRELEERGEASVKTKRKVNPTEKLVAKQAELMKELWLPSDIKNVKESSSRSVMGFVTYGGYSFTQALSYGYGLVALSALLTANQSQNYVMVRNVTSLQYYFARLKLL